MADSPTLHTRREFLRSGLAAAGLVAANSWAPAFLARTAAAAPAEKDRRILVVLQMSGGNDGLNMLVPFADDRYQSARPTLGLKKSGVLSLNDRTGLHPSMRPLARLFEDGHAAFVQGVGYPNPDRSHFRSMEIWHTASREIGETRGWLGRYFDAACSGNDPHRTDPAQIGMSFGKVMPQTFRNRSNVGLAIDNPGTFRWNPSGETPSLAHAQEVLFKKINSSSANGIMDGGKVPGGLSGDSPETLDFLRHTAMNAVLAGDRVRALLERRTGRDAYPAGELGAQFRMISRLIAGDFPTRVYYVSQGGYDTHGNQTITHARLLGEMADALGAFHADLRGKNLSDRVLVLAFSEFGRRVAENASKGTDHGAAAPVILMGDGVKSGIYGSAPDLGNLEDGDLRHGIDFRSVYACVLRRWLDTDPSLVLAGGPYPDVAVL